jgi:alpha-galactosidase
MLASAALLTPRDLLADNAPRGSRQNTKLRTSLVTLSELPDDVFVEDGDWSFRKATKDRQTFSTPTTRIAVADTFVRVACPKGELSRVVLRWRLALPASALFLGDHWERAYGDLQWRTLQPERVMPWYFAAHEPESGETAMFGVATQPAAFCFWTVDCDGISLWLDFRNGGSPSRPGDREIVAAQLVSLKSEYGESPMAALKRFCRKLCVKPRLPAGPIVGNNNWYYAYGHDFDAEAMRRDARFLAELTEKFPNQAYCVIDAGWTPGSSCPGGPWLKGDDQRFPDMPGLANDMKKLGVRPGIWVRPTALTVVDDPKRLRSGPINAAEKPLDLTLPENTALIHADVARLRSWGYELIKHDFSTFDLFGRWGPEMGAEITDSGWHFADRSLTNAEIVLRHYQNLRDAAGDAVLIGCNTIGHLGAGLFEVQRTGDDTSGHVWERTRRMGVNTLAYRLPQHGTFFVSDADCVALTEKIPWALAEQFLDVITRSGTALFISTDPRKISDEQKDVFKAALHRALSAQTTACEPIDWLDSTSPRHWRFGDETKTYDWTEDFGTLPFRI